MIKKKIIKRAKKTLSTEIKEIQNLSKIFNDNFYRAVILLSKVKGRVIITGIGKSAHIGNKIAATLTSTGTPSYFIHPTEASHGDLGGIKKTDCVLAISNSGETSELNNIINYTKRFDIPLISISSNTKSLLNKNSTIGIVYKKPIEACPLNLAPTSSTTISLVIGDCLAMALLELKGFTPRLERDEDNFSDIIFTPSYNFLSFFKDEIFNVRSKSSIIDKIGFTNAIPSYFIRFTLSCSFLFL